MNVRKKDEILVSKICPAPKAIPAVAEKKKRTVSRGSLSMVLNRIKLRAPKRPMA